MITETTNESWFSRIGSSFKGILTGFVLVVASIAVLFWNEGRTIKQAKALKEGAQNVLSVDVDKLDPSNEGKLIHVCGEATTTDVLNEDFFGVSVNALKLSRVVEAYQWEEDSETKTERTSGGGEKKTTTYSYRKVWSSELIDSSRFKESGHDNPTGLPVESAEYYAPNVSLGAFKLPERLIARLATDAEKEYNPFEAQKAEEAKSEEAKSEEAKSEEAKAEEAKAEEAKAEEAKAEEAKAEEAKAEEAKAEEAKAEEAKVEEAKSEEAKSEEAKAEEAKAEEAKAEEAKSEETKAEEAKAEETKAEEAKPKETKAEETKAEEAKTEEAIAPTNEESETSPSQDSSAYIYSTRQPERYGAAVLDDYDEYASDSKSEEKEEAKKIVKGFVPYQNGYYKGDPNFAQVGDVRVSFAYVPTPSEISVVSEQLGDTFAPYQAKTGEVELVASGQVSADKMFSDAQDANKTFAWLLRAIGAFLMFCGFNAVFRPLVVLSDVVPFMARVVDFGTGFLSFCLTVGFASTTIAIGWLFYRPLIGVPLLILAIAAIVAPFVIKKKKNG